MEKEQTGGADRSEEATASNEEERREHEQDGTENETFDTDQHSDAPGPFGTG